MGRQVVKQRQGTEQEANVSDIVQDQKFGGPPKPRVKRAPGNASKFSQAVLIARVGTGMVEVIIGFACRTAALTAEDRLPEEVPRHALWRRVPLLR